MMIETTLTTQPAIQEETFEDLTAASTSSTAFWDNPLDDEDWNNLHIRVRIPIDRVPTHPGEMLLEEFLTPMNITQQELADAIQVPYKQINEIVNGKRGVTPSTALRLAKFFGISPDFWMNLQLRWDLYWAQQEEQSVLASIEPRPMMPVVSHG